jgi:HD-GYP domain-containing protein (c-di-GMP phosphodiesterase class II)
VLGIDGLERIAHSLLITPLHVEGKPLGLLYGADKINPGSGLSTVDSKLCASLGSSLSIYLKNVLLYADMHSMFIGTLHALSTTIDAKDSYTHGHSERVALVSRQLAEAAGLDAQTIERIYLSGLVHDVGKIGVPEAVLTKPGRLTSEEYDLVKKHPEIGAKILEGIRQMKDLIPGVLYHHESWDGSGYPHGLAGRDIPLFGRIIGLADAFDAMSSDRTYRHAMPMHEVLDEIRRCSGRQFDPDLADVFVRLDFGPFLDMIERHHDRMRNREEGDPIPPRDKP